MTIYTCIYCLMQGTAEDFSREHVLPKSLGTFHDSPTLLGDVCKTCNQFFGDTLEPVLTRDSYIAHLRYVNRIKDWADVNPGDRLGRKATRAIIRSMGGDKPARPVELVEDGIVRWIPHVTFRSKGSSEWIVLTEHDLDDATLPIPDDIDMSTLSICIRDSGSADDLAAKEEFIDKLKRRGVPFREGRRHEDADRPSDDLREVQMAGIFTPEETRCAAKIAFNYLAKITGGNLAQGESFDAIRRFIRYGDPCQWDPVRLTQEAILPNRTAERFRTSRHVILLYQTQPDRDIVCKISFFNDDLTYVVTLAKSYPLVVSLKAGHIFDLNTRLIHRL